MVFFTANTSCDWQDRPAPGAKTRAACGALCHLPSGKSCICSQAADPRGWDLKSNCYLRIMSLHRHPELKEAVLALPQKEKDKLLVRLINKDKMLLKQLHYELLEDQSDLDDRIQQLQEAIALLYTGIGSKEIKNLPLYPHYKELSALLRKGSGMINEHERITKDRYSVVECRLLLLRQAFQRYPNLFRPSAISTALKLQKYVKGRIKNLWTSYHKLHEDLQFDLQNDLQTVLNFAQQHGLDDTV